MSDKAITDFNSSPNEQVDIVQYMRDWVQRVRDGIEERERIDKERAQDPNWEWSAIHICSREIAEIMLNDTTAPEIRHGLRMATYACHQWVWVGEGEEPKH